MFGLVSKILKEQKLQRKLMLSISERRIISVLRIQRWWRNRDLGFKPLCLVTKQSFAWNVAVVMKFNNKFFFVNPHAVFHYLRTSCLNLKTHLGIPLEPQHLVYMLQWCQLDAFQGHPKFPVFLRLMNQPRLHKIESKYSKPLFSLLGEDFDRFVRIGLSNIFHKLSIVETFGKVNKLTFPQNFKTVQSAQFYINRLIEGFAWTHVNNMIRVRVSHKMYEEAVAFGRCNDFTQCIDSADKAFDQVVDKCKTLTIVDQLTSACCCSNLSEFLCISAVEHLQSIFDMTESLTLDEDYFKIYSSHFCPLMLSDSQTSEVFCKQLCVIQFFISVLTIYTTENIAFYLSCCDPAFCKACWMKLNDFSLLHQFISKRFANNVGAYAHDVDLVILALNTEIALKQSAREKLRRRLH